MRTALTRDKNKRRQTFRLEFLEGRELLSVAQPAALRELIQAARVATPAPITAIMGRAVGFPASAGEFFQPNPGYVSYSGHGSAQPLGYVNFGINHLQTKTAINASGTTFSLSNGSALLGTKKNETIFIAYTGTAVSPTRGIPRFNLAGTITGGTGRFAGATGTFSAAGTFSGGRTHVTFVLAPKFPTV